MDSSSIHFDSLPAPVREAIFLRLRPSDLNTCLKVSGGWRDFIEDGILRSRGNRGKKVVAAHRRVFGKLDKDDNAKVEVDSMWMLAACDQTSKMFYTLSKPTSGNDWTMKQYSCADKALREVNSLTLSTQHFVRNMQLSAGHLVLYKQPREQGDNAPAVFSLTSLPWGGRVPIENGMRLPCDAFHFTRLLLGNDTMYVVSKNAHVTWTKAQAGAFSENTHETFAEPLERPIVIHRLTRESSAWQEVVKVYPQHAFTIMETYQCIPNKEVYDKYKDNTCILYLNNNIITDRHLLVCCPLHGSYEMYDYDSDYPMWKLDFAVLPFENLRSILKDALNDSTQVLAAVRDKYVFVYSEVGKATLLTVEEGNPLRQIDGKKFVLSPRYVVAVDHRTGKDNKGFDYKVTDVVSGRATPTITFQRKCMSNDAFGDRPWHIDEEALADFEGIAKQLLPVGPQWPVFEEKAESYWGFGHTMLEADRMVYWARLSANKFEFNTANVVVKTEDDNQGAAN